MNNELRSIKGSVIPEHMKIWNAWLLMRFSRTGSLANAGLGRPFTPYYTHGPIELISTEVFVSCTYGRWMDYRRDEKILFSMYYLE